jgi:hypothetical protein
MKERGEEREKSLAQARHGSIYICEPNKSICEEE